MSNTAKTRPRLLWVGTVLFLWGLLFLSCPSAQAEAPPGRTVRVGYTNFSGFQEGGPGEHKSGSGYEYLQRIAYLTGWEYEYVYGTFSELIVQLENGEIDLLGDVSPTEERAQVMSFSDYPEGKELFYLFSLSSRHDMHGGGTKVFNGRRIGVTANSYQEHVLRTWLANHELTAEIVLFNGSSALLEALDEERIDAAVMVKIPNAPNYTSLFNIGYSEYYFAVAKQRTDLLEELNEALYLIQNTDPYYNESVYSKYNQTSTADLALSAHEEDWLAAHDTLTIGYIENYLPFCATDENGHLTGILTVVMEQLVQRLELQDRLELRYQPYTSYSTLLKGLESGEVDTIFPVMSDLWYSEQIEQMESSKVIGSAIGLVYRGNFSMDSIRSIAVAYNNPMQEIYAAQYFPEYRIVECSSAESCLNAVLTGRADATIFNFSRAQYFVSLDAYYLLHVAQCPNSIQFCFHVRKGDTALLSLLNRGLSALDSAYTFERLNEFIPYGSRYRLIDFVRAHPILIIFVSVLFTSLVFAVLALLLIKQTTERDSKTDPLTGCGNRKALNAACGKHGAADKSVCVIMGDLNGLKQKNDAEGHEAGDAYIRRAADTLRAAFGARNVFRLGGDEFVVLLFGLDEKAVAQKLRNFDQACADMQVSISYGAAFRPVFDEPFDDILRDADSEMYASKSRYYAQTGSARRTVS